MKPNVISSAAAVFVLRDESEEHQRELWVKLLLHHEKVLLPSGLDVQGPSSWECSVNIKLVGNIRERPDGKANSSLKQTGVCEGLIPSLFGSHLKLVPLPVLLLMWTSSSWNL